MTYNIFIYKIFFFLFGILTDMANEVATIKNNNIQTNQMFKVKVNQSYFLFEYQYKILL